MEKRPVLILCIFTLLGFGQQQIDARKQIKHQNADLVPYTNDHNNAVTRNVRDKLNEHVSIMDFGAVCDGTTDDTTAIQRAIDSGVSKVFVNRSVSGCRITAGLNITQKAGLTIEGENSNGSAIYCDTGVRACVDLSGSFNVTLEHLKFYSGINTPNKIGVLEGRTTTNLSQYIRMLDVYVYLGSDATANGGRGTIGLYNFGAELQNYDTLIVQADAPVVITATNIYSVTSAYRTMYGGTTSVSQISFSGSSNALFGARNAALTLDGTVDVTCNHIYLTSTNVVYFYALLLKGANTRFMFTGHIEGYPQLADIYGSLEYSNIDTDLPALNFSLMMFETNGGMKHNHIKVRDNGAISQYLIDTTGSPGTISNCWINLGTQQSIRFSAGVNFYSNVIMEENSGSTISVPANSTYVMMNVFGNHFVGPTALQTDFSNSLLVPNNQAYAGKDTGGTVIGMMEVAADNTIGICGLSALATNGDCIFYVNGVEKMRIAPSGNITMQNDLTVSGHINMTLAGGNVPQWVTPPANSTAACTFRSISLDGLFFYVCYATNHWTRFPKDVVAW
jgi:hypothetical protein